MAMGYLAAPGTEYGPCETECEHESCVTSRTMLAAVCPYCDEPIGTEGFFDQYYDQTDQAVAELGRWAFLVHGRCHLVAIEAT